MKILKGYVFRLYPNIEQKTLINKTTISVRLIYNIFLKDRIDTYNNTKKREYKSHGLKIYMKDLA